MNYRSMSGPLMALAFVSLSGCSALAGRAGENGSDAWVTKVYRAGEMTAQQLGCANAVDPSAYRNDEFVLVREPHGRRMVSVVARVPHGMQVKVGDEVEIEPARCRSGVIPAVKQVFKQ